MSNNTISDGWEIYPGHVQFILCAGCHNQAAYVIAHYPKRAGIKTYFIGGNHDLKSYQKQGIDQCSLMVNGFDHEGKHIDGRKDLVYLGQYSRMLLFPQDVTCQIIHPHGGSAYAISYPQQKRAREMKSATKPDIQISGHYHVFSWITQDTTEMIALQGVQDETEFFVRLGFGRQMGFCIADYEISQRRIKTLRVERFSLE